MEEILEQLIECFEASGDYPETAEVDERPQVLVAELLASYSFNRWDELVALILADLYEMGWLRAPKEV